MAIYNNREVTVIGANPQANSPESINIEYKDGTHENVKLDAVKFTEDEKKALIKSNPGRYDNVDTIKDEDLKAVRVGIAPTYDPSVRDAAYNQALRQKQIEEHQKQAERVKSEQDKKVSEDLKRNTVVGQDRAGQQITKSGNVAVESKNDARR